MLCTSSNAESNSSSNPELHTSTRQVCDVQSGFRELTGECTNPSERFFGAVGTVFFSRKSTLDSKNFVKGSGFPNPRDISNAIGNQGPADIPNKRGLSSFLVFFGQFLDHCFALTEENPDEEMNLEFTGTDPFRPDVNFIHFARSVRDKVPNTAYERPRVVFSSAIDVTAVYGVNQARLNFLRKDSTRGLMDAPDNLMPLNSEGFKNFPDDNEAPSGKVRFIAGDRRSNENAVLTAFHILFLREHNRIAKKMYDEIGCSGLSEDDCDEKIFSLARRFNGLQFQKIVYEEFIPLLTDMRINYSGFNSSVNPSISNVFATAAYRFGHSMIPETIEQRGPGNALRDSMGLIDTFGFASSKFQAAPELVEEFLRGSIFSFAQEADTMVVNSMRNLLFSPIVASNVNPNIVSIDLLAVNIQRSRDHALPCYNEIRMIYGLSKYTRFSQITSNSTLSRALERVYRDINYIDAWIGLMAEDKVAETSFGPTMLAIWKDEFNRMAHGDYFHYRNWASYPDDIRYRFSEYNDLKTGDGLMQKIVTRNTDITDEEIGSAVWIANPDERVCNVPLSRQPAGCRGMDESF